MVNSRVPPWAGGLKLNPDTPATSRPPAMADARTARCGMVIIGPPRSLAFDTPGCERSRLRIRRLSAQLGLRGRWRGQDGAVRAALHLTTLRFFGRFGLALFRRQKRLPAETNLSGWIDVDHLDHHLIPLFQFVPYVLDAVVRNLGDVEQSIETRHDLDEGAEITDPLNLADVGLIEFRRGGQFLDDRDRFGG